MIQIVPMTSSTDRRRSGTSGSRTSVDVAAFDTAAQSASLITAVRAFCGTSRVAPVSVEADVAAADSVPVDFCAEFCSAARVVAVAG